MLLAQLTLRIGIRPENQIHFLRQTYNPYEMTMFKRERAVEIVTVSGTLRVTVQPRPAWLPLFMEAIVIVVCGVLFARGWASMAILSRLLVLWGFAGAALAWLYQLSGSENIEFDDQKLVIGKQMFVWNRIKEYAISDCRDLEWREPAGEGDPYGLQCKVGWRDAQIWCIHHRG